MATASRRLMFFAAFCAAFLCSAFAFSQTPNDDAVLRITIHDTDGDPTNGDRGVGSGVIIDKFEGGVYLGLTCWHNWGDHADLKTAIAYAQPVGDTKRRITPLLSGGQEFDVVLFTFESDKDLPVARIRPYAPAAGEQLQLIGFPRATYKAQRRVGVVSSIEHEDDRILQVSFPNVQQGFSGGPVLTADGELAGIIFGGSFTNDSGMITHSEAIASEIANTDYAVRNEIRLTGG